MPNNVIQKVYNGGNEYLVGGGSAEGAEVVYLTQAEYDVLPASKLTDGKIYKIKTSGVAPTPGGGTAVERGDMLLSNITGSSENEQCFGKYVSYKTGAVKNNGIVYKEVSALTTMGQGRYIFLNNRYLCCPQSSSQNTVLIKDLLNDIEVTFSPGCDFKIKDNYLHTSNLKFNLLNGEYVEGSNPEYASIPSGLYYKGLYYSQDNDDYVAVDATGTEVKRYSNVGTINGIYDDKLYRNVGDVAYAIATL